MGDDGEVNRMTDAQIIAEMRELMRILNRLYRVLAAQRRGPNIQAWGLPLGNPQDIANSEGYLMRNKPQLCANLIMCGGETVRDVFESALEMAFTSDMLRRLKLRNSRKSRRPEDPDTIYLSHFQMLCAVLRTAIQTALRALGRNMSHEEYDSEMAQALRALRSSYNTQAASFAAVRAEIAEEVAQVAAEVAAYDAEVARAHAQEQEEADRNDPEVDEAEEE